MARSDLLLTLASAGSKGDQSLFRRTLEAIIADERAKQHHTLADRLTEYTYATNGKGHSSFNMDLTVANLLYERTPHRRIENLFLPAEVQMLCAELIEEQQRKDLLRSYGLEPRHRVLLVGPPGNGKTSLAEALAESLMLPLLQVRYEGLIGSFLGETASRMAKLFEYVCTRQCVLFLDEFDTIGKERGDVHETGEIKRVVSSLLLQIDALPSYVVVVTATNHPELLDRAVWRRFQLRLELSNPPQELREAWFKRFLAQMEGSAGMTAKTLADRFDGASFADLEEFCQDIRRRQAMAEPAGKLSEIVRSRLRLWEGRFTPATVTRSEG